ncbi:unnamed protein product [Arctogadus glacialis]
MPDNDFSDFIFMDLAYPLFTVRYRLTKVTRCCKEEVEGEQRQELGTAKQPHLTPQTKGAIGRRDGP